MRFIRRALAIMMGILGVIFCVFTVVDLFQNANAYWFYAVVSIVFFMAGGKLMPEDSEELTNIETFKNRVTETQGLMGTEKEIITFESESLCDLLKQMALAGRRQFDTPHAKLRIEFDEQSIGVSAQGYNSVLASLNPIIRKGKALLCKAEETQPGENIRPTTIAQMMQMAAELEGHEEDAFAALDMVFSEDGRAYNSLEDITWELSDVASELRYLAETMQKDDNDTLMFFDETQSGEPWYGRQYHQPRDDRNKPHAFETWHESFNRPVNDGLEFLIEYVDANGEITERTIHPISIHLVSDEPYIYIKAFCTLRQESRSFRSDRIQTCRNLKTNRVIKDLGDYLRSKNRDMTLAPIP